MLTSDKYIVGMKSSNWVESGLQPIQEGGVKAFPQLEDL